MVPAVITQRLVHKGVLCQGQCSTLAKKFRGIRLPHNTDQWPGSIMKGWRILSWFLQSRSVFESSAGILCLCRQVPDYEDRLSKFERMCVVKTFREDRTLIAAADYISDALGQVGPWLARLSSAAFIASSLHHGWKRWARQQP